MARRPVTAPMPVLPMFSDLHLKEQTAEVALGVVASMRAEALALGAREVGFAGDFYHVRGLLPVPLQNAVVDELDRWAAAGLTLVMIPGNHDQVDVVGRNALEVFRTHPAVRLYDQPMLDAWGLWIPYRRELDDVRRILTANRGRVARVFWHGPIVGARMNDTVRCEVGLAPSDFEGYAIACLGHFHARQSFGVAHYIGSPWETRADEAGQAKGYAILDGDGLRYVDRAWGPRHVLVTATTANDARAQLERAREHDLVRVSVPEEVVGEVSRALAGRFAELTVTPQRAQVSSSRVLPSGPMTWRAHAERYVDERHGELSSDALMRVFGEVTG